MEISARAKVRRYGLSSQKLISAARAERLLKESGMVLNDKNKNCLFIHNREGMSHWVIKSILFKLLRERGRTVGTEVETRGGIVDLVDVDNRVAYEIESRFSERRWRRKLKCLRVFRDVFIIDAKKVPNDFKEAEKYLKEKIV